MIARLIKLILNNIFPHFILLRITNVIFATEKISGVMYKFKTIRVSLSLIALILSLFFTNQIKAAFAVPDVQASDAAGVDKVKKGQDLFKANCASCHKIDSKLVGPALMGSWDRWESEDKLVAWVQNSQKLISSGDAYANKVFNENNKVAMTAFPQLTKEQVQDIFLYVKNSAVVEQPAAGADAGTAAQTAPKSNTGIFYFLIVLLAVLALVLWNIVSKLNKIVNAKEGVAEPEAKPFFGPRFKKTALLLGSVLLVFNIFNGAIDLGRSQGYAPDQPIRFSHALHVGQNQIDCQYCHIGVEKSRHASIPGTQICMNCHKAVNTGPKYGKDEIKKIYYYAGWDPDQAKFVREPKNIEWVKIHNLPDHVYFNHSQHYKVGGIKCQTCHGKVEEYEVMKQFAPLSMGWCINCHRQTEVKFNDNKYYSIFQRYQKELKEGKKDKITVADVGGTDCQKCHY